jgi:hypothetical protein
MATIVYFLPSQSRANLSVETGFITHLKGETELFSGILDIKNPRFSIQTVG